MQMPATDKNRQGCITVLGRLYFARQAKTLLQFAKSTSNPELAASLIERAARTQGADRCGQAAEPLAAGARCRTGRVGRRPAAVSAGQAAMNGARKKPAASHRDNHALRQYEKLKRPLTVWISGLPGQNRCEMKKPPAPVLKKYDAAGLICGVQNAVPGIGTSAPLPARHASAHIPKFVRHCSDHLLRTRDFKSAARRPPLIVISTFIFGDGRRRRTVIVVRHSLAP